MAGFDNSIEFNNSRREPQGKQKYGYLMPADSTSQKSGRLTQVQSKKQQSPPDTQRSPDVQEYAQLFENAPVGYVVIDINGNISKTNKTAAGIMAAEPADLLGKPFEQFIAPDSQNSYHRYIDVIYNQKRENSCVVELVHESNQRVFIQLQGAGLENRDGEITAFATTMTPSESPSRIRLGGTDGANVLDSVPQGLAIIDNNRRIVYANPVFEDIFGPANNVECEQYFRDNPDFCPSFDPQTLKGRCLTWEARLRGTDRTYEIVLSPFAGHDSEVAAIEIVRDITGKKLVDKQLRAARDELQQRVHHRTSLLANTVEELKDEIDSRKKIEQNLRLQSRIVNNMAQGICVVKDEDLTIVFANPAFQAMCGYQSGTLVKESFGRLIAEQDSDQVLESIRVDCRKFGQIVRQLELKRKNGQLFTARMSLAHFDHPEFGPVWLGACDDITAYKEAQLAQAHSRRQYEQLVQNTNSAIIKRKSDGTITFINRFAQEFFGYSEQEILGKNVIGTIIPPQDSAGNDTAAIMERMNINPEDYLSRENENIRKDGTRIWLNWTNSTVKDDKGNVTEILSIGNDITLRVQAQQALIESERRYRRLVELSPQAVMVTVDGIVKFANSAAVKMLCAKRISQLVGIHVTRFIHPDDTESARANFAVFFNHKSLSEQLIRLKKFDDSIAYAEASAARIHYQGKPGALTIFSDVTERIESQRRLQHQQETLQKIVDNIPVMLVFSDQTGNVLMVNQEFSRLIGYDSQEMQNPEIARLCFAHEKDSQLPWHMNRQPGRQWIDRKLITRLSKTVETSWANVRLADGTSIGIGIDSTDRRRKDRQIHEYHDKLRSMAAQLQLTEEREKKQIAEDLHDSTCQILAFAVREIEQLIYDAPGSMQSRIQELNGFLRQAIEQTRSLMFDLSPATLYDLGLESALSELTERFTSEHKVECIFQDDNKPKPIQLHTKVLLYRSTRELLINAIKHADAQVIVIKAIRNDDRIDLRVQDDGRGFDVEKTFSRPDMQHKGFGLMSIKERIRHIGGDIVIESEVSKGTRIKLSVPLEKAP